MDIPLVCFIDLCVPNHNRKNEHEPDKKIKHDSRLPTLNSNLSEPNNFSLEPLEPIEPFDSLMKELGGSFPFQVKSMGYTECSITVKHNTSTHDLNLVDHQTDSDVNTDTVNVAAKNTIHVSRENHTIDRGANLSHLCQIPKPAPKILLKKQSKKSAKNPHKKNSDIIPNKTDIIMGRGGGTNHHPGNILFRSLLRTHALEYKTTNSTSSKISVAIKALDAIDNHPTKPRFLRMSATGKWEIVNRERLILKAQQFFRDSKV